VKNRGNWDEARKIDYEVFQEHLRTLGTDHVSTLSVGYNLAEIELQSGYLDKASEWCQWVTDNVQRVLGAKHALSMKTESLMGEVLCQQGKYQESESVCANVLARQQMNIGEEHYDTLDTRRRLGMAYNGLVRRKNAILIAEKLTESLKHLLGDNHIRVYSSVLDTLEYVIYNHSETSAYIPLSLQPELQQAMELLPEVHQELLAALGRGHPLTIRALSLHGRGLMRAQQHIPASETLRRALAISEEALGPDHALTMDIVGNIGVMYAVQVSQYYTGANPPSEALPWLVRYLNWVEQRKGPTNPETQATLEMLGNLHFAAKEYEPAEKYFERTLASYRGTKSTEVTQRISSQLQLCRTNNMLTSGRMGSRFGDFLSHLQRF
jgi:tetratricopeptide (TPR) repeat protein